MLKGGWGRVGQCSAMLMKLIEPNQGPAGKVPRVQTNLLDSMIDRKYMSPKQAKIMKIWQPGTQNIVTGGLRELKLSLDVGNYVSVG